jgi:hypothetical protein
MGDATLALIVALLALVIVLRNQLRDFCKDPSLRRSEGTHWHRQKQHHKYLYGQFSFCCCISALFICSCLFISYLLAQGFARPHQRVAGSSLIDFEVLENLLHGDAARLLPGVASRCGLRVGLPLGFVVRAGAQGQQAECD